MCIFVSEIDLNVHECSKTMLKYLSDKIQLFSYLRFIVYFEYSLV